MSETRGFEADPPPQSYRAHGSMCVVFMMHLFENDFHLLAVQTMNVVLRAFQIKLKTCLLICLKPHQAKVVIRQHHINSNATGDIYVLIS